MVIEERIIINASRKAIFTIYRDVENWSAWDPDTKSAFLEGAFEVGSCGKIVPTKGYGVPIRMTVMVPDASFTVEGYIPLFSMVFEHQLRSQGDSTEVMHRVSFKGPLRFLLGRIIGGQISEGLPITMRSLKEYAEAKS